MSIWRSHLDEFLGIRAINIQSLGLQYASRNMILSSQFDLPENMDHGARQSLDLEKSETESASEAANTIVKMYSYPVKATLDIVERGGDQSGLEDALVSPNK